MYIYVLPMTYLFNHSWELTLTFLFFNFSRFFSGCVMLIQQAVLLIRLINFGVTNRWNWFAEMIEMYFLCVAVSVWLFHQLDVRPGAFQLTVRLNEEVTRLSLTETDSWGKEHRQWGKPLHFLFIYSRHEQSVSKRNIKFMLNQTYPNNNVFPVFKPKLSTAFKVAVLVAVGCNCQSQECDWVLWKNPEFGKKSWKTA